MLQVNDLGLVLRCEAHHGFLVRCFLGLFQVNIASDIVRLAAQELLLEIVSVHFVRELPLHFLLLQDESAQVVVQQTALRTQPLIVGGGGARDLSGVQDHLVEARHTLPALLTAEDVILRRDGRRLVLDNRVDLARGIIQTLKELVTLLCLLIDSDPLIYVNYGVLLDELGEFDVGELLGAALETVVVARALLQFTKLHAVGRARLLLAEKITRTVQVELVKISRSLQSGLGLHIADGQVGATHLEPLRALHIQDCFDNTQALK